MKLRLESVEKVSRLGKELAEAGREDEAAALEEVLAAAVRPGRGWLTTGQAAERLGVAVQTVKNWIDRGTLRGTNTGTRWLVSEESVETVEGIRRTLAEAADEGLPTPEEVMELAKRTRKAAREKRDVA